MLKEKYVAQPQYYNNKELCKVLGVETTFTKTHKARVARLFNN